MILLYNVHFLSKANSSNMHIFRGSSSKSNSSILVFTLHIITPAENLTYLSPITKKGEIVSASSAP